MSMLSEPRRRQKWSLNPRGTLWAKDDSKFGKKLLEKMGWTEGVGLGATNQGMVDPITLKAKDNQKGIGYQGHDDVWLDHQNDFEAVLASLNGDSATTSETGEETKMTSLEEVSKKGKKRVHYTKFTRGKDLSQYSTEDLGCILGSKRKDIRKAYKEDGGNEESECFSGFVKPTMNVKSEDKEEPSVGDQETGVKSKKDKKKKKRSMSESVQEVHHEEEKVQEENEEKVSKPEGEGSEDQPETEVEKSKESSFVTVNRGSMNAYFEQKMAAIRARQAASNNLASSNNEEPLPTPVIEKGEVEPSRKRKRRKSELEMLEIEPSPAEAKARANEQSPKKKKKKENSNLDTEHNIHEACKNSTVVEECKRTDTKKRKQEKEVSEEEAPTLSKKEKKKLKRKSEIVTEEVVVSNEIQEPQKDDKKSKKRKEAQDDAEEEPTLSKKEKKMRKLKSAIVKEEPVVSDEVTESQMDVKKSKKWKQDSDTISEKVVEKKNKKNKIKVEEKEGKDSPEAVDEAPIKEKKSKKKSKSKNEEMADNLSNKVKKSKKEKKSENIVDLQTSPNKHDKPTEKPRITWKEKSQIISKLDQLPDEALGFPGATVKKIKGYRNQKK